MSNSHLFVMGQKIKKKSKQKKIVKSNNSIFSPWNCIFGSFKLFPTSKIDFWPFLKLQKNAIWSKKNSWNWFIWFHEFIWLGLFFNFLAHCAWKRQQINFSRQIFSVENTYLPCWKTLTFLSDWNLTTQELLIFLLVPLLVPLVSFDVFWKKNHKFLIFFLNFGEDWKLLINFF